jgi:hypothetical protein
LYATLFRYKVIMYSSIISIVQRRTKTLLVFTKYTLLAYRSNPLPPLLESNQTHRLLSHQQPTFFHTINITNTKHLIHIINNTTTMSLSKATQYVQSFSDSASPAWRSEVSADPIPNDPSYRVTHKTSSKNSTPPSTDVNRTA